MRGGKRKGAGRKSAWQNQKTCTIRVPVIIAQQLLEIAHELDQYASEHQLSISDVLRQLEIKPNTINGHHPTKDPNQKES
ncbi:hypothetical protein [Synechococcus sp. PCC 6312]|uniref:hypothetical protein n=1 Tax=Synechococcus sp. (strain ATCC 27167 / PCC 6312) TaxID=195253 RepID=UPI00029ECA52|nr:hypothetical protein [Synechococcus sp. PCC 6312]AFY60863.1 hypothetical protein Syn6312_1709 [Synechococcus sp. PCC 6312]